MIGPVTLIEQKNKPWTIGDNDIHSKSIQAWMNRNLYNAKVNTSSVVSDAYTDSLFEMYVAEQQANTIEFNEVLNTYA